MIGRIQLLQNFDLIYLNRPLKTLTNFGPIYSSFIDTPSTIDVKFSWL